MLTTGTEIETAAKKYAFTLARKGMHHADVEDAIQDFCVGVIVGQSRVDAEREGAATYLYQYGKGYVRHTLDKKSKISEKECVSINYHRKDTEDMLCDMLESDDDVSEYTETAESVNIESDTETDNAETLPAYLVEILETLSARDRDMVIRHAVNGETLTDIAKAYGITKERVRQITEKAYGTLRAKL